MNVFKAKLPLIFQRKIMIDGLVSTCLSRNPVDLEDYKRLKREQKDCYNACQKIFFPSKKDK